MEYTVTTLIWLEVHIKCPLSLLLFLLSTESLAVKINNHSQIFVIQNETVPTKAVYLGTLWQHRWNHSLEYCLTKRAWNSLVFGSCPIQGYGRQKEQDRLLLYPLCRFYCAASWRLSHWQHSSCGWREKTLQHCKGVYRMAPTFVDGYGSP